MSEYVPRNLKKYKDEIIPHMMKKFGYNNVNQVPKILKISMNMGVGDGDEIMRFHSNRGWRRPGQSNHLK